MNISNSEVNTTLWNNSSLVYSIMSDNIFMTFMFHENDLDIVLEDEDPSDRRLSLLGVTAGFVLLLLLVAMITCARQKKIYEDFMHRSSQCEPVRYYRVMIHMDRSRCDDVRDDDTHEEKHPPDYESVMKMDSVNLPDYQEAVK